MFHSVRASVEETFERAGEAPVDRDVRIGGGIRVVWSYLSAGVVDRLHVGIAPILLGGDEKLSAELREFECGHLTFAR